MANLKNNFPDDQPQTDSGAATPRPMSAAQHDHFKSLVGHTLTGAAYGGHGHAVGKQGPKGHEMVPNDSHRQAGSYIPRGVLGDSTARMPQSHCSDGRRMASKGRLSSASPHSVTTLF